MPQIGDRVIARYLEPRREDGTVVQGAVRRTLTAAGELGVELDGEGHVASLVIETDGGATFIPQSTLISVEVDA